MDNIFTVTMYAVVLFPNENDDVAVINEHWLSEDRNNTYWPPEELEKKVEKLQLLVEPGNNWELYPIRILQMGIESYIEARQRSKLAEVESDLDNCIKKRRRKPVSKYVPDFPESSDEERSEKAKRQKVRPKTPPTLFENITNVEKNQVLPFRRSGSKTPSTGGHELETDQELNQMLPIRRNVPKTPSRGNELENSQLLDVNNENLERGRAEPFIASEVMALKRKMVHLQQTLDSMGQLMESMNAKMDVILAKEKNIDRELFFSMEYYPLKDMESFIMNEEKLKETSFRDKCINWLKLTGGYSSKNHVQNIMRKVFVDDLALQFSFKGQIRGKYCFCNSGLFKMIQYVLQQASVDNTDTFIQNVVSEWLTQAKFRKDRRLARASLKEPSTVNLETNADYNVAASSSSITSENGKTYNNI